MGFGTYVSGMAARLLRDDWNPRRAVRELHGHAHPVQRHRENRGVDRHDPARETGRVVHRRNQAGSAAVADGPEDVARKAATVPVVTADFTPVVGLISSSFTERARSFSG